MLKEISQSLFEGEQVLYSGECSNKPELIDGFIHFIALPTLIAFGLYFYNPYTGHDYYGVVAIVQEIKKDPVGGLFMVLLVYVPTFGIVWLVSRDKSTFVVTNKRVLCFRPQPRPLPLPIPKENIKYFVISMNLTDIVSLREKKQWQSGVEIRGKSFFKRLHVSGLPDLQAVIQLIKKAANLNDNQIVS